MKRLILFFLGVGLPVIFFVTIPSLATVYIEVSAESKACNSRVADAEYIDGFLFDTYYSYGQPYLYSRCAIVTPAGTNFLEWVVPADTLGALVEIPRDSISVVMGRTYYLAAFVRFDRINAIDIWHDTGSAPYSFDKLIEFQGPGIRWGIGSGWNGWYPGGADHKFTFDAWYATSVLGNHGPDHIIADQSPYGASSPYLCDYERWYAIVLGITAQNNSSGRVQLWVNGTKLIDQAHYTANSGSSISNVKMNGTIAQPGYDSSSHKRQIDRVFLTDNWNDILNRGYLQDPDSGHILTPPNNLRVVK